MVKVYSKSQLYTLAGSSVKTDLGDWKNWSGGVDFGEHVAEPFI